MIVAESEFFEAMRRPALYGVITTGESHVRPPPQEDASYGLKFVTLIVGAKSFDLLHMYDLQAKGVK